MEASAAGCQVIGDLGELLAVKDTGRVKTAGGESGVEKIKILP